MIEIAKILINGYADSYFVQGPVFVSWQMVSHGKNIMQSAYRMQIAESESFEEVLWDSGEVLKGTSQFVETTGFAPKHLGQYHLRVKVQGNRGQESPWSQGKSFLYLKPEEFSFQAQWVSAPAPLAQTEGGFYLRRRFRSARNVKRAFLISAAQGMYQPYLDGIRISHELFLPGWTAYENRIQYQVWDITEKLGQKEEHVLGCILAPGWFRGRLGETGRGLYGERIAWMAQVQLYYEDDSKEVIATDEDCRFHGGPLVLADLYDGETYDARLETEDWCSPDSGEEGWLPPEARDVDKEKLWPQIVPGVCTHECFFGVEFVTPAGEHCIDFGQNMAGLVSFQVQGAPGDKVEFTCFEALDKDGNVYTENLRSAKQTITYYCKGEGQEHYMPQFSYQGFRYIHIRSWPGRCDPRQIKAYAVYSDMIFHGSFTSSSGLVNRLMENIRWSMKSNFVDIPTDCPQRDERLGWTGDAQIFSETAVYLANVYGFYEKWLLDVAGEQYEDGGVPHLVPDILRFEDQSGDWLLSQGTHSAAAWADAIVLIPWRLHQYYGNKRILETFYDNMKRWIDFMQRHSEGYIWNYKLQFGDWLALDGDEESYFGATPNELTCTVYFAYSTSILAKIARVLGREEDSRTYGSLYRSIRQAFLSRFLEPEGILKVRTQTALAMALHFGLLPEEYREQNARELKKQIQENGNHMTTGFMGTPCILMALSENGFVEEAYDLLLREEYPSWLYQVKKGATTVWEHLDGMKPDGSMWSSDMNSFNHYAYGAVAAWLYTQAAGIQILENAPGFTRFKIQPKLSDRLPKGCASIETPYGKVEVSWERKGEKGFLKMEVPPGTQAEIILEPYIEVKESGDLSFTVQKGYRKAVTGSGIHTISYGINKVQRK